MAKHSSAKSRRAFTLVELLITVSIVAIMASMVLFALFAAQEQARVQKTRALIVRLDSLIRERYDSYRTRRVPIKLPSDQFTDDPMNPNGKWDPGEPLTTDWNGNAKWDSGPGPYVAAKMRLDTLRDLMRMEMPDRWSDVYDIPATPFGFSAISPPSIFQAYRDKYATVTGQPLATLTRVAALEEHQGAECLYMIVMESLEQAGDAREVFKPDDIADTDNDGFPEFIDAWGIPIRFLRWAPGFQSELHQIGRATNATGTGTPVTITLPGQGFANDPGRYISGTVAVLDTSTPAFPDRMAGNRTARITAYQYSDSGTPNVLTDDVVTFTCDTVNGVPPFAGIPPSGEAIVLMGPDPFDPRGIFPMMGNPDTLQFTFGLHPLIYSAGSNKCFGVRTEPPTAPLQYTMHQLNPFRSEGGELIGETGDFPAEQNFVSRGWVDNIHNHQLNLR